MMILNLLLAVGSLMSCHRDGLLEPEVPGYFIVDGDTVKIRQDVKNMDALKKSKYLRGRIIYGDTVVAYIPASLHTPPEKAVNLEQLKSPNNEYLKGKPFRYIAYGGSITAGVRDGGYFNEGMETSYPNLIARQLGIKDFVLPKFENNDYNGFGRLVLSSKNYTGGPVLKFNISTNNSGVDTNVEKQVTLRPAGSTQAICNWGVPFSTRWEAREHFGRGEFQPFAERLDYQNNKPLSKQGDLITMEHGFSDMIAYLTGAKDQNITDFMNGYPWGAASIQEEAIAILYNTKGQDVDKRRFMFCVFNVPDILDLPILHYITSADVEKSLLFGKEIVFRDYKPDELVWYPNPTLDSLMGKNVSMALKDGILKRHERGEKGIGRQSVYLLKNSNYFQGVNAYNDLILKLSKEYSFPIIDMKSMYSRIRKGEYVTHDGIKVEFRYPAGNFYSLDGIHPTAFGQAVIANEVISTLNKYYKIQIPLIPTKDYLKR
ncbi:MAG: hypothetical protein KF870_06005 [Leadbetterella sp.]|nr:hypothetical protein [Leadbetterella sp.]